MCLGMSYFVRTFGFTIKSHKRPGEVGLRILHTGPKRNVLGPLGQWFKVWCQSKLRKLGATHLVANSADVSRRINSMRFPFKVRGVKLDDDQYFLTGTPDELKTVVLQICDDEVDIC